jgi:hypothetical protein
MGPARRAHHPKIRNGGSGCNPRTGAQAVGEPRPTKLGLPVAEPL